MAQECYRRLLHTSEKLPTQARVDVLDKFAERLYRSGYNRVQARHCITAGIKKYERTRLSARRLFRSRAEMGKDREICKEVSRTTWFHDKIQEEDSTSISNTFLICIC